MRFDAIFQKKAISRQTYQKYEDDPTKLETRGMVALTSTLKHQVYSIVALLQLEICSRKVDLPNPKSHDFQLGPGGKRIEV